MPRGPSETTSLRKQLIYEWAAQHKPVTVRQLFYRLSTLDAVPKTEAGYKMVSRLCTLMRQNQEIPYEWFADNSRRIIKPRTYLSIADALTDTATYYRKSLWMPQDAHVEVWIEKEALVGVVQSVTLQWDVPLLPVKGYPSLTFLYEAASTITDASVDGKSTYIYYFGDYDPSGVDIYRNITEKLQEFAPHAQIHFTRKAVTPQQIQDWELPERPTKKTDSRAKAFGDMSVELDAIEPDTLRNMVEACIYEVMDTQILEETLDTQSHEKEWIQNFVRNTDFDTLA